MSNAPMENSQESKSENDGSLLAPQLYRKNPIPPPPQAPLGVVGINDAPGVVVERKVRKEVIFDPSGTKATTEETKATQPAQEPVEVPAEPYTKVDYKKRYDDLKRHHDRRIQEFKTKERDLQKQAAEARPKYKPPKTPEELATFRQDNPDLYAVVESVAHMQANQELEQVQDEIQRLNLERQEIARNRAVEELASLHPDFSDIRESEDFQEWAGAQSEEIQGWLFKNATNARLAARAIDLYKLDKGIGAKDVQRDTQIQSPQVRPVPSAADAVPTRGEKVELPTGDPRIWTRQEIDAMSLPEYEAKQEEIFKAMVEGRVR